MTLPAGWISIRLGELTSKVGSGATPRGGETAYKASGIPLIRSMNVHFDSFRMDGLVYLDAIQARALDGVTVATDDVLLNITGASIGRVTTAPAALCGSRVNQHVAIIRPIDGVSPRFLARWLASPRMQRTILDEESGATRQALTKEKILGMEVPLPPGPEQRRIVAKLDAIFEQTRAAKARLERLPALLEKLKRSILAAAFRGDLTADWRAQNPDVEPADKLLERFRAERRVRCEAELAKMRAKGKEPETDTWKAKYQKPSASGDSDLPDLPAGWCWTTIGTVGDILNGRQRAEPKPGEATRPYLRIANIKDDEVAFDDVNDMAADPDTNARYSLLPGDILVSAGQSLEKIGQSAMFLPGMPDVGFQKNIFRFRSSKAKITPEYAQLAFRTFVRTGVFLRRSSITTNLAYLTTTKFAECPFPLAPEREQLALVQLAKQLLGTVKAVEERIVRLVGRAEALDQSILVKAFRGELAAQDPNDEPAGVLLERIRAARAAEPERPRRGRGQRTAHTKVSEVTTVASNGHAATGQHDESLDLVVGVFQINRRLTTTAITAATGLDGSAVTKALKILVDGGQVRARGTTYEWSP